MERVAVVDVEQIVGELVEALPHGAARLKVSRYDVSRMPGGGIYAEFVPRRATAARLALDACEGGNLLTVEFGSHSLIEIGWERASRREPADYLAETRAVCKAIVEGRCRERIWIDAAGSIVESEASIRIDDRTVKTRHASSTTRPRGVRLEDFEYDPY